MHSTTLIKRLALATVVLAIACDPPPASPHGANEHPSAQNKKDQVIALLKAIETGDSAPIAVINPNHYTQHNLSVGDGLAGFGALVSKLPPHSARVETVRVYEDGAFVFARTDYNFFGPKVGFDIFRVEDGKIVEHWDNLQEKPASPNPSGHTMLDETTAVSDLDKTAANKAVAKGFVDEVLGQRRMDRVPAYVDAVTYTQHNPHVADGSAAMVTAFQKLDAAGTPHRYNRVHKVLGQGDFVLTASEGLAGDQPTAFYDLFRIVGGKIVEHWDVLGPIPARSERKNSNGKS